MKLELRKIHVNELKFGSETKIEGEVLTVCKEELISELEKIPNVKSISIDLAMPGEKTRIIPVKDVIQPRYTVKGTKGFSGVTSEVKPHGDGIVNVIDGAAIVTIGDIVGFQEGIIDMWGEGARWTPFSKTCNIVVDISVPDNLEPHEHEEACRLVGLRASELVGMAAKDLTSSDIEVFEMGDNSEETSKYPDLPKVVYVEMLISQGLL